MSQLPPPPPYYTPPEPMDPQDRTLATLSHVGTLANLLGAWGWAVPLVILLVKTDRPVVRKAAVESLNFQISMFAYAIVSLVLMLVLVGFVTIAVVGLLMIVMPIIAAVKTNEGVDYRYPLTFRLIK